jgi:hypothetical protein
VTVSNDSPRYFFDTFLEPNYRDWLVDTDNIRLAMNAAVSANQMADWCLIYWSNHDRSKVGNVAPGKRGPDRYRKFLVSNVCSDFSVIRDVADCHKHLRLENPNARITSATNVREGSLGWNEARWGEGKFGGTPQLIVYFDDATKRAFSAPMKNVFAMWDVLLTSWGI